MTAAPSRPSTTRLAPEHRDDIGLVICHEQEPSRP